MIAGRLVTAPSNCRGFDTNMILSGQEAGLFAKAGYKFAIRYVPRITIHTNDFTAAEAQTILRNGLALMIVQHVESAESWTPSAEKGTAYGEMAATSVNLIGLPPGTMIWLDLEGVALGTPAEAVIAYCNQWHAAVAGAGFYPGLYVGWHPGLTSQQLYNDLRFTHYWSSYNLNADELPAIRGVQMRQRVPALHDHVANAYVAFQVDVIRPDALGGVPRLFAPENWTP